MEKLIEQFVRDGFVCKLFEPGPDIRDVLDLISEHFPESFVEVIHGQVGPHGEDAEGHLLHEIPAGVGLRGWGGTIRVLLRECPV